MDSKTTAVILSALADRIELMDASHELIEAGEQAEDEAAKTDLMKVKRQFDSLQFHWDNLKGMAADKIKKLVDAKNALQQMVEKMGSQTGKALPPVAPPSTPTPADTRKAVVDIDKKFEALLGARRDRLARFLGSDHDLLDVVQKSLKDVMKAVPQTTQPVEKGLGPKPDMDFAPEASVQAKNPWMV